MAETYLFKPHTNEATQNFDDYVQSARELPFVSTANFFWEDRQWDLTGLANHHKLGRVPKVHFDGLAPHFAAFARAFTAYRIGEKFGRTMGIDRYANSLARLRDLCSVAMEMGIEHPVDLTLEAFDETAALIAKNATGQKGQHLQNFALHTLYQALCHAQFLRVPFDWTISTKDHSQRLNRINVHKANRALTETEVEAIAIAFRNAKTDRDIFVSSVLALLCCVPARIGEILALPADCEVIAHPGDGYRAGIRWHPKKGGPPQVKFVPDAMVPIAKLALERLRQVTEPAREAARRAMAGDTLIKVPNDFPVFDPETNITFDRALCVAFRGQLSNAHKTRWDHIIRVSHSLFPHAFASKQNSPSVFEATGAIEKGDMSLEVLTHRARHYVNMIANRSNVPQADIALWSGRKLATQNSAYDHETAKELVQRIRERRGPETLPTIAIENPEAFDVSLIKQTAHTTLFGYCLQSLRQNPCEMFGSCLDCQHLVCVKGADGKLENIKAELDRTKMLRDKVLEMRTAGVPQQPIWLEQLDRKLEALEKKTARLVDLVEVLGAEEVEDGTTVRLSVLGPEALPQYDPIGISDIREQKAVGVQRNFIRSP